MPNAVGVGGGDRTGRDRLDPRDRRESHGGRGGARQLDNQGVAGVEGLEREKRVMENELQRLGRGILA